MNRLPEWSGGFASDRLPRFEQVPLVELERLRLTDWFGAAQGPWGRAWVATPHGVWAAYVDNRPALWSGAGGSGLVRIQGASTPDHDLVDNLAVQGALVWERTVHKYGIRVAVDACDAYGPWWRDAYAVSEGDL